MTLPIRDKAGVLDELRVTLHLCEVALQYSTLGDHGKIGMISAKRADRLREAIRFIEEHADGAAP